MKQKWYDYLISYSFERDSYLTPSHGTMEVSRTGKINSFDAIRQVKKLIQDAIPGSRNILINNIMYLGRNIHE
jgi:hypothetical protein